MISGLIYSNIRALNKRTFQKINHNRIKVQTYQILFSKCIINWQHNNLQDVGVTHMSKLLEHFFEIKRQVENFVTLCNACQNNKIPGKHNYGVLPHILTLLG